MARASLKFDVFAVVEENSLTRIMRLAELQQSQQQLTADCLAVCVFCDVETGFDFPPFVAYSMNFFSKVVKSALTRNFWKEKR